MVSNAAAGYEPVRNSLDTGKSKSAYILGDDQLEPNSSRQWLPKSKSSGQSFILAAVTFILGVLCTLFVVGTLTIHAHSTPFGWYEAGFIEEQVGKDAYLCFVLKVDLLTAFKSVTVEIDSV